MPRPTNMMKDVIKETVETYEKKILDVGCGLARKD